MTTKNEAEIKNILFIDDKASIVNSLKLLFRRQKSYQIYTTIDQKEAIDIVKNKRIHVVVSDMKMPGISGTKLLSIIKQISPNSMRLLLTGYAEIGDILDSINQAQVFRFIEKPWNNTDLKKKIEDAANISQRLWQGDKVILATDKAHSKNDILFIGQEDNRIFNALKIQTNITLYPVNNAQQAIIKLFNHKTIDMVILHVDSYSNQTNRHSHYRNSVSLIKLLKSSYPALISIVIAKGDDYKNAISLINEAQIFRYITEPVSQDYLIKNINEALDYVRMLKLTPLLASQHHVEEMPEQEMNDISDNLGKSFFTKLINRIQIIRQRA